MEELKTQLAELVEAYAAARPTQNRLLQTWAAQNLLGFLNEVAIAPLPAKDEQPQTDGEAAGGEGQGPVEGAPADESSSEDMQERPTGAPV